MIDKLHEELEDEYQDRIDYLYRICGENPNADPDNMNWDSIGDNIPAYGLEEVIASVEGHIEEYNKQVYDDYVDRNETNTDMTPHEAMQDFIRSYEKSSRLFFPHYLKARVKKLAERTGAEPVDVAMQVFLNGLASAESNHGFVMLLQQMTMDYVPSSQYAERASKDVWTPKESTDMWVSNEEKLHE